MQFVQSGVPTNTNDLLGVYRSLAANMALSYLAGLEDVHQENVLLLRDRVQVIDMEATTGRFTKNHDNQNQLRANEGGFRAMLWDKALQEGIKPKLVKAARDGTLQSAPQSNAVQAAMRQTFTAVLGTAEHNNFNNDWQQQTQALGGHNARIVPIATASFYQLIASATNYNSLNAWQNAVDHNTGNVIDIARGQGGATDQFLANVLRSPGTYNALRRGEIPYYTRNLGRSTGDLHQAMQNHQQANANAAEMLDEEGHPIDGRGSPKIGQDIGTEMNARRTELQNQGNNADVHLMFEAQIVNSVAGINNEIRNAIQAHHNQQNNQNQ
jgi:hypothetical protein